MQKKHLVLAISFALTTTLAQAQDSTTLETVTVEDAFVTPTPIEDFQELSESTATDLKDVLADQPSVGFGGGNGAAQWMSIRGLTESQIDLVVDDASSTSQMFHHQSRFSLDPALVKVIDIEKGTGSASSGIGATGGRIVAKTVDAADLLEDGDNFGARINGGVSSNAGHNGGLAVYGRSGSFDGIVVANWNKDKNYEDGHGDEAPYNELGSRSFLAKGAYNIDDNNRIELSHRREEQYGTRTLREEFYFDGENDTPRYKHATQDTTSLSYEGQQLGALGQLDANLFYIKNVLEEGSAESIASTGDSYSKALGANVGFTTPIGSSNHKVKYGINWRKEAVGGENSEYDDQKRTDSGLYLEGIWDFEPVTLTTGVRYDHFDLVNAAGDNASDAQVNPSLGVIWDVTDNFALNASYNIASRSPRLMEAYYNSLSSTQHRANYAMADDLTAETAKNAEIGFNWDYNGLSLEGALFYQTIEDLQNFSTNNDGNYALYNEGELKNRGYELSAAYRIGGLTARAGMAYNEPTLDGTTYDNIAVAVPMGRQWTTSLSYQFDNPNLEIGWRGRYAQRSSHSGLDRRGNPADFIRAGYGVHDLYLNWKPTGKDDMNVNFSIDNVGNKYYKSHSQRTSSIGLVEPGRNYRLNFNYQF